MTIVTAKLQVSVIATRVMSVESYHYPHRDAAQTDSATRLECAVCTWKPLPEQHRQQVFPNGTLIVKDIQKVIDEGGYVCIATDPDGSTARSKLNVQVTEAPEIDPIIVKPDLQEGMRMNLMCVVSKGDFPIAIQWLKDGVAINYEQGVSENSFDEYSSTLSFNSLMMKHTGNYTCQASNAAASRNYTVEVVVNGITFSSNL
ncbi:Down syndrome cell adhesion molecule-like protein Dscam2 [Schistocerca serialis cubense]|uniref:Down syndrome cell adhesion molecule-like protein Dscam2 n=1 Tax=Schistocerca serialis cubense TaxID=2023355 RepID=UPI00214E7FDF|nr:Down syndrome cell adhesion molecule-like protein Dscam2 [Schistocerca serialis cubense]